MKKYNRALALLLTAVLFSTAGLTGCGKKETDPNATEVMKLNIALSPSPAPEPEAPLPEAVTTKGTVTMVNEYLDEKLKKEAKLAEAKANGESLDDEAEDAESEGSESEGSEEQND